MADRLVWSDPESITPFVGWHLSPFHLVAHHIASVAHFRSSLALAGTRPVPLVVTIIMVAHRYHNAFKVNF